MTRILFLVSMVLFLFQVSAQTDSSSLTKAPNQTYTRYDSVSLARLNSNANLMIAGGVGLCVAGGYLIYQGIKVYTTTPDASLSATQQKSEIDRNHRQGIIYLSAAGVGIAAGIILSAFGAKNKINFKNRKKAMELQSGILESGNLGLALRF